MRSKLELQKKISKQRPLRFTLKNRSKSTAQAKKSTVTLTKTKTKVTRSVETWKQWKVGGKRKEEEEEEPN